MEAIDIAIIVMLIISVVLGIFRGFLKEIVLLITLVLALVIAYYGSDIISGWITDSQWEFAGYQFSAQALGFIAAFSILLLLLLVIRQIVANVVGRAASAASMGLLNGIFGAAFGALRGAVLVTLLIAIASLTMISTNIWWQRSQIIPTFESFVYRGIQELPPRYREHFYLPSIRSHTLDK